MRELLRAPVNRLGVTALRRMPTTVIVIVLCRCYAGECEPKLLEHNDFQRYHLRWNNSPHISSSKCSIVPGLDHISRRGRELSSPTTEDGDRPPLLIRLRLRGDNDTSGHPGINPELC